MRIKKHHINYITSKLSRDLLASKIVTFCSTSAQVEEEIKAVLHALVQKEAALDEKVNSILQEQDEQIELMQVDRKNMFWLLKNKLASEFKLPMNYEDRYNILSHDILNQLKEKDLINYQTSDNRVRNVILRSLLDYLKNYEIAEDEAYEKINNYKRKLIPGSEEFEIVFARLYEEELKSRGLI